jgi:Resolvase, N terminal domain
MPSIFSRILRIPERFVGLKIGVGRRISASSHAAMSLHPGGNGPDLATDNELVRNILLALLSSLAKVEAQKISERTKAGMARAKAKGIKVGRPKIGIAVRQQIAKRAAKGQTPLGHREGPWD